jgi:hypothetical protein
MWCKPIDDMKTRVIRLTTCCAGGGTFFEENFGNTWARYRDQYGAPMEQFDVALLPVSVQGLQLDTEPVEEDEFPFYRLGSLVGALLPVIHSSRRRIYR